MILTIGILTLSDRASNGIYDDKSGIAIRELMDLWVINEKKYIYKVIPDEFDLIVENLNCMVKSGCDIIFTTGGTGPAPRDVTPEATQKVCDKILPGFGEQMRLESLKFVPTAILSRQIAGIKDKTFILNLPGNPKAIKECLEPVFSAIPYCVDLIGGAYIHTNEKFIKAFRPNKFKK